MSRTKIVSYLIVLAVFMSCKSSTSNQVDKSLGYLPLQVGNYWEYDDRNYIEIKSKKEIEGHVYYEFYKLMGGDAFSIEFLRIDFNDNLVGISEDDPNFKYTRAKFNLNKNDVFCTIGDGSINDALVTVTEKTEDKMTFRNELVSGVVYTETFVKGIGFYDEDLKEIRIGGKVVLVND